MLKSLGSFRGSKERQPSFFWRGAFIILPVLVLTVLGLLSLRQDRLLAEAQGRQRAQDLAEELANAIVTKLQQSDVDPDAISFVTDSSGQLISPPPKTGVPVPQPLPTERLTPEQLSEWTEARTLELEGADSAKALEAFKQFLARDPPDEFAALAQYSIAQLAAQNGDYEQACESFRTVAAKYPEAVGESGLALRPFAEMKWIDAALKLPSPQESVAPRAELVCSNAVFQPTLLTPRILDYFAELTRTGHRRVNVEKWRQQWLRHEQARVLFTARGYARPTDSRVRPVQWVAAERVGSQREIGHWLVLPTDKATDKIRYACWPATVVTARAEVVGERRAGTARPTSTALVGRSVPTAPSPSNGATFLSIASLAPALQTFAGRTPPYFGYRVELAGSPLFVPVLAPESSSDPAWAKTSKAEEGTEYLIASVLLTDPVRFYSAQRQRALWFGLLVLTSAVAAMFGYLSAHRAFRRQQRLAEMKSNFVSSVSHELRAPIASVRLMAEGLERGNVREPQKQHEYFRFIVQECRRLSAMIENVLDFARIDQGRNQYEMEATDLAAVLRQTIAVMQPSASEKRIRLEVVSDSAREYARPTEGDGRPLDASGSLPLVWADGHAIQQAIINLVDNALKHSPAASVVKVGLELGPRKELANGEFVQIWVEDQGSGIPSEEHEKIFERFYRFGSELRRETQGVGIGLSIVKHIAQGHGGTVVVRSAPGEGSRFTIVFPYRPADRGGARTASSARADYQSAVQQSATLRYVPPLGNRLYRRLVVCLFGGRGKDIRADETVHAPSREKSGSV